jgi:cytidine deaminase
LAFCHQERVIKMKEISRDDLSESLQRDLQQVEEALSTSYCPHSGLCVAAGLILDSGELITGVNYESASYGLTQCAERNAISRAQAENKVEQVQGLLLSACYQNNDHDSPPLTPCGACRQWLSELSDRLGRDFVVYSFWKSGRNGLTGSARELLPQAFL